MGAACAVVAEAAKTCAGVSHVLLADNPVYEHRLAENGAALVAEIARNHSHVLASATTFGKNLLPRVAALLDWGNFLM
ncbi:electron transfer flavoprotein, alpha subunit [Vibrio fluvialis]|uniref:Electron transfer flavoprotein, alpha subunit n=1 Tax=Vibrio fluvialis TaxID=676 RepID=A0AAX2LWJ5_VIBFL|nr:electron transfer flavoprotein, alpha subunit [Vibrio fluvialis]